MKKNKIVIVESQKDIIEKLGDELYTVDFLEEWINRHDRIGINAPSALQAVSAKGFYRAVLLIESSGLFNGIERIYQEGFDKGANTAATDILNSI